MTRFLLVVVATVLLGAACAEQGAATPQAAATGYLAAAQRGDVSALVALAPETYDARSEAETKVAAYRLVRDRHIDITYRPNDITPNELAVDFTVADPPFHDVVQLQRMASRWYVLLGRSKANPPAAPTAQASR